MYMSRAEDLVTYWAAEAKRASTSAKPPTMRELAAKFGGKHG